MSWSPDGKNLAYTLHRSLDNACEVHIVPSDPKDGNTSVQFSNPPFNNPGEDLHDYDPQWSPLA